MQKQKRNQNISAIMGLVVGDALGVSVEFIPRIELKLHPVTDMRGYGTHNQPAGTWSDDSSMVLATTEWFSEIEKFPLDYARLMDKFSAWLMYGDYTPYGVNFDCGIATNRAIMNYGRGTEPISCGGRAEFDNGNGSLMRILPAALWFSDELAFAEPDSVKKIYEISALTHAHARSKVACFIYARIIADMIQIPDENKIYILEKSLEKSKEYLEGESDMEIISEIETYNRIWNLKEFMCLPENKIESSGYVVDTLEAAIWCFLNTESYKECVLKAVNLGEDTDTVGAVAGGLAGLYYGYESIPVEWVELIPKREWIVELAERM